MTTEQEAQKDTHIADVPDSDDSESPSGQEEVDEASIRRSNRARIQPWDFDRSQPTSLSAAIIPATDQEATRQSSKE